MSEHLFQLPPYLGQNKREKKENRVKKIGVSLPNNNTKYESLQISSNQKRIIQQSSILLKYLI